MCHVWNRHSATDLCNKGRWARLRLLRVLSLWSTDCEKSNVQIGELFRLEWPKIKAESDLISHTEHLKPGLEGRDCLLAAPRSDECLACFNRMDKNILMMEKAYEAFNHTLRRFDCTIAVDASSATRPFSPNGTCEDCKMWYRKWLLVQLLDIWHEPPCINWCYYAQLACPHIASSRQVDYAGQPSFFCRDLKVSKNIDDYGPGYCKCFHPCDLERTPPEAPKWYEKNKNRISTIRQYDFFASNEHCWARKRICDAEKLFEESAIDGLNNLSKTTTTSSTTTTTLDSQSSSVMVFSKYFIVF
uniref:Uncharacterized protein n=1 Tax=Panagrolaimus davidi TaxID=227884 RepID=A0A914PX91_9BILA